MFLPLNFAQVQDSGGDTSLHITGYMDPSEQICPLYGGQNALPATVGELLLSPTYFSQTYLSRIYLSRTYLSRTYNSPTLL